MNPLGYARNKLEERRARREQESPADKAARVTTNATVWMAVFTFVLMLVGVGTYLLLKNQLQEMHQGGIDAQTFFRDGQRAWVGVQGTTPSGGFTEREPWTIAVVFFNSGRTPATNVQSSGNFIASPIPISGPPPEQVARLEFRPAQSIAPQANYTQNLGSDLAPQASTEFQRKGQESLASKYSLYQRQETVAVLLWNSEI